MKPSFLPFLFLFPVCALLGQSDLSVGLSIGPGARQLLDDKSWVNHIGEPGWEHASLAGNNLRLELGVRAKVAERHFISAAHAVSWQQRRVSYRRDYFSSFICDCDGPSSGFGAYSFNSTYYSPSISHEYLLASNGKMAAYLSNGLRLDFLKGYERREIGVGYQGRLHLEYSLSPRLGITASPYGTIGRMAQKAYGQKDSKWPFAYGFLLGMSYRS